MRKLQQLCVAVVLTLAFTTYSFAGIIDSPPAPPPPPPEPGIIGSSATLVATVAVTLVQIAVR